MSVGGCRIGPCLIVGRLYAGCVSWTTSSVRPSLICVCLPGVTPYNIVAGFEPDRIV
jgi:hypothetical protein